MPDEIPQQDVYGEMRHKDITPFIPTTARSVLDVGCSRGGFGLSLREHLGPTAYLAGLEPVASAAEVARVGHGFDEVITGYFPDALSCSDRRYDVLTFNDVLEHMLEPWDVLRDCHDFLSPDGVVVAVIPSIQYFPVVLRLLRGRWDYQDTGTLDRTHVRFFTRATMVEMFEQANYEILNVTGIHGLEQYSAKDPFPPTRWAKTLVTKAVGDMKYLQFVVVARRKWSSPS